MQALVPVQSIYFVRHEDVGCFGLSLCEPTIVHSFEVQVVEVHLRSGVTPTGDIHDA